MNSFDFDQGDTGRIMFYVLIALLPPTIFGIYTFGVPALFVVLVTTASAVLTEYIYQKILRKKVSIGDFSAIVTGLLLALNLPAETPWWICVLGSVFAILVVKQLFGGFGKNILNPAATARSLLLIIFTGKMTTFTYGGITSASPLSLLHAGESIDLLDMFIGNVPGTIGETSTVAILIGAIFLIVIGVIDFYIPTSYLLSFIIFIMIFSERGLDVSYIVAQLCGGGLMLGIWFMATDYTTSPNTRIGQILYGVGLGILTGVFRVFFNLVGAVSYAIIINNLLVPTIEKLITSKFFGKKKEVC